MVFNVVGFIDCIKFNFYDVMFYGYWWDYFFEMVVLVVCIGFCFVGSFIFVKVSNVFLVVFVVVIFSIFFLVVFNLVFIDVDKGIEFMGVSFVILKVNFFLYIIGMEYVGFDIFRSFFGVLFLVILGIFVGVFMLGDF